MKETINPKLRNKWEAILAQHGLSENIGAEKFQQTPPFNISLESFLESLDSEVKYLVEKFTNLSKKSQEFIISDIKDKRHIGMESREIFSRINTLVSKSEEYENLGEKDSDEKNIPKTPTGSADEEMERLIRGRVEKIIRKMEEIIKEGGDFDPENPGDEKRDIN